MVHIRCRHCDARLRVSGARPGSRIRCPSCGRTTPAVPETGAPRAGRRPKRKAGRGPWLLLGGVVLATPAVLLALKQVQAPGSGRAGDPEPLRAAPASESAAPERAARVDPREHPATRAVLLLASALAHANTGGAANLLDLAALHEEATGGRSYPWAALDYAERRRFQEETVAALLQEPVFQGLGEGPPDQARFLEEAPDRLVLELRQAADPAAWRRFTLHRRDGAWKVAAWERGRDPESETAAQGEEEAGPAGGEVPEALLADLDTPEERAFAEQHFRIVTDEAGNTARLWKGEIRRVELVEGTSSEEQQALEEWIQGALTADGLSARFARRALERNLPKALPLILNRIADRPLTGDAARQEELAALDALLRSLTWRDEFPFPMPGVNEIDDAGRLRELQQACLEAWFGWWEREGRRWEAWKERKGIPDPPPERRRRGGPRRPS